LAEVYSQKLKSEHKQVDVELNYSKDVSDFIYSDETRLIQVVIIGHMGRPSGFDKTLTLDKVARRLSSLLGVKIKKFDDFLNINFPKDKFVMLENLRFSEGEGKNSVSFSKQLASFGDLYVNDAFAVSHRKAASIVGITKFLPSYPGFDLEKEVKNITKIVSKAKSPFVLLLGGAKIDKLLQLKSLIKKADAVLLGGKMIFPFIAKTYSTGKFKFSDAEIREARKLLNKKLILPLDVELDSGKVVFIEKIPKSRYAYDIGSETITIYSEILKNAKTIIWNGPMGYFEGGFGKGTRDMAKAVANSGAKTLIGGGDTLSSVSKKLEFTHASTAGGAFLQLISGKKLVGVEVLNKN